MNDVVADLREPQRRVHFDAFGAGDTGLAHAACDDGRVGGLAAAARQDALGGEEAVDVFRPRLLANEDHLLASIAEFLGEVGIEDAFARRGARRGRQARRERLRDALRVESRVQQLLEQLGVDAQQRLLTRDQFLGEHVDRRLDHRRGVHLAVTGLQAIQRAFLDRELVVLHLLVVRLERVPERDELLVLRGHLFLHAGERLRRADAGHDVLTLRVGQVFAEHLVFAGARVAREAHAGRAVVALVAEHHRADVDGRAVRHVRRDVKLAAVVDGALAHPRAEHGLDGQFQLLHDVLREVAPGLPAHDGEEMFADFLQVLRREPDVRLDAGAGLDFVEVLVEMLIGNAESDLAEQLNEAAVRVVGKALVAGLLDEARKRLGVEPEVQNRVHHAGHRHRGTGSHGDQQRVAAAPEGLAGRVFERLDLGGDRVHQAVRQRVLLEIVQAGFRRYDKSGRDVNADLRHFAKVCTLAAQELLVLAVAVIERVNVFFSHSLCHIRSLGNRSNSPATGTLRL